MPRLARAVLLPQVGARGAQLILIVFGEGLSERWPTPEDDLFFGGFVLVFVGRLELASLLFVFFCCVQLVHDAMLPLLGPDARGRVHAKRFLLDVNAGRYDSSYHYYDVLAAVCYSINGQLNARRRPACPYVRLLHVWDAACARVWARERRWPTLAEQRAFFSV